MREDICHAILECLSCKSPMSNLINSLISCINHAILSNKPLECFKVLNPIQACLFYRSNPILSQPANSVMYYKP